MSSFQPSRVNIPPPPDRLLENAFAAAKRKQDELRQRSYKTPLSRAKTLTKDTLKAFTRSLTQQLHQAVPPLPSTLPPRYQSIIRILTNPDEVERAARRVQHAIPIFQRITRDIRRSISSPRVQTRSEVDRLKRHAIGRLTSLYHDIHDAISILREYARLLHDLPSLPEEYPLILIMGLPNTGKTTLYNQLTQSEAETAAYAFTTKRLNTAFLTLPTGRVILVDTPGLLPRREKNEIERLAEALLPHARLIIIVQDPAQEAESHRIIEAQIREKTSALVIHYVQEKPGMPILWQPEGITSPDELKETLSRLLQEDHDA